MHQQKTPFIDSNVLKLFCVPLYTDYLCDLHKKFQAASPYNTDIHERRYK